MVTAFRGRAESALLVEQITDLRAKMKFWATESRIVASTDTKILLAKVDALSKETDQIGIASSTLQKQILGLNSGKRDLLSRMGLMVPVSVLNAAKAESDKLREMIEELKNKLREAQGQVEDRNSKIQVRALPCSSAGPSSFGGNIHAGFMTAGV